MVVKVILNVKTGCFKMTLQPNRVICLECSVLYHRRLGPRVWFSIKYLFLNVNICPSLTSFCQLTLIRIRLLNFVTHKGSSHSLKWMEAVIHAMQWFGFSQIYKIAQLLRFEFWSNFTCSKLGFENPPLFCVFDLTYVVTSWSTQYKITVLVKILPDKAEPWTRDVFKNHQDTVLSRRSIY